MTICTKEFWHKNFTKDWLKANTTFECPKTVSTELLDFPKALEGIKNLPTGHWVFKPDTGLRSQGVVLFEKMGTSFCVLPDHEEVLIDIAKKKIFDLTKHHMLMKKDVRNKRKWFVEEWIHPHEQLHQFTLDARCPPIIRFCGHPEVHFIGMSTVTEETGISGGGWQDRKYIWLDLQGIVRPMSDMYLSNTDTNSVIVAHKKSLESAPFGLKIVGVSEVVEQINREIVPKISLYNNLSWSCDGTFNTSGKFVALEMNYTPGLQFRGFSWSSKCG